LPDVYVGWSGVIVAGTGAGAAVVVWVVVIVVCTGVGWAGVVVTVAVVVVVVVDVGVGAGCVLFVVEVDGMVSPSGTGCDLARVNVVVLGSVTGTEGVTV
jgi:hypothetical protein